MTNLSLLISKSTCRLLSDSRWLTNFPSVSLIILQIIVLFEGHITLPKYSKAPLTEVKSEYIYQGFEVLTFSMPSYKKDLDPWKVSKSPC